MKKIIVQYRFYIILVLVFVVAFGGLFLLYESDKLSLLKNGDNSNQNEELINKINQLEERISTLESSPVKTTASVTESESISESNNLININVADQKTLESLPGIGEKRASDIILYRESNGGFETISEIKNIKGIGDSIYGQIKDSISVD